MSVDFTTLTIEDALEKYESSRADWLAALDTDLDAEDGHFELWNIQHFWHECWNRLRRGELIDDGFLWCYDMGPYVEQQ